MISDSDRNLKTVPQVAAEMGMTSNNVRYHLRKWRAAWRTVDGVVLVDADEFAGMMAGVVSRGRLRVRAQEAQVSAA